MIDLKTVKSLAEECDSFYVYDEKIIIEQAKKLKAAFPMLTPLYSLKANPHPEVVVCLLKQGFGVDAASLAEVKMGLAHNLPRELIQYSAPGKSNKDLTEALPVATVVADSLGEVERLAALAENQGKRYDIGLRINPCFNMDNDSPLPNKFGIDEEQLLANVDWLAKLESISICGIHLHLRSQELDIDKLGRYHAKAFALATCLQEKLQTHFSFLNLGSGIGVYYESAGQECDVMRLGDNLAKLQKNYPELSNIKLYIETGRYVVCEAGFYVTRVMDIKSSRGKTFVILKNTLNGFFKPSVACMVNTYNRQPAPCEPLFTSKRPFDILTFKGDVETEIVTLVGNLCTAADVIAQDIELPKLEVGDLVVLTNAGSYARVLSPLQFSSQEPPKEFFVRL